MTGKYDIVFIGLTITSSWGNGHATTYRSLIKGLAARGRHIAFLERDAEWYASNRDQPEPPGVDTFIYTSFDELVTLFEPLVAEASVVIVGSYVPDGGLVGEWVTSVAKGRTAFYDIDTPITLASLESGTADYISEALIGRYNLYLSFTGGPTLRKLENRYGSPMARPLYCSVDPELYKPVRAEQRWDLGYLGTYSADRQPVLEELLLTPAGTWSEGRFAVAGPLYPEHIEWAGNVDREIHLSPREHPMFYCSQRFTLNVTRAEMKKAGYSPSVRLFEAAACGVPIISDWWTGLDESFTPEKEILIADSCEDVLRSLRKMTPDRRWSIAAAARKRVLAEHTPAIRAEQLESYLREIDEHYSSSPAWRNGRGREVARGTEGRVALKSNGIQPSELSCAVAVEATSRSDLQQPTRKDS